MSLKELRASLEQRFAIQISNVALSKLLKNKLISFKLVKPSVQENNSKIVRQLRKIYVDKFLSDEWRMNELIYIDECSFNLWIRIRRGWKTKGKRLNSQIPNSRGSNISLVLVIAKSGPVHFNLIRDRLRKLHISNI